MMLVDRPCPDTMSAPGPTSDERRPGLRVGAPGQPVRHHPGLAGDVRPAGGGPPFALACESELLRSKAKQRARCSKHKKGKML